jgi:ATP synthase protein I
MLLVIGVGLGCVNAWFWVSRERRDIEAERRELPKEDENDTD